MTLDMEKFEKLTKEAANRAAGALSQLTGIETNIRILNVHIEKLSYQFEDLASDEYVTAISLPIRGDLKGSTLLLFPKDISMKLAALLTKDTNSSTHGFDAMEVSALKEVGNIVCGSFLTVLANQLSVHVVEHLPLFIFDTLSTVLSQLHVQASVDEEDALLIEVRFEFDQTDINGYVVLVFGLNDMDIIKKALNQADI